MESNSAANSVSASVVWITGASRGIGRAIAERLVRDGYRVALSARSADTLRDIAGQFPEEQVLYVECDVREEESVYFAYKTIEERFGRVDILVNNAGMGVFAPLVELPVQDFDDMIATNLRGVFLCAKAVLPAMLRRKSGTILTINSVAAVSVFTASSGYGASKAGALAMSRSLRAEVRDHNIRVIDIILGATETEIWDEDERDQYRGRMIQPDDVADIVPALFDANRRMMVEEIVLRPQRGDL